MPKDDLVGRTFSQLTVRRFAGYPERHPSKAQWLCDCSCGTHGLTVFGYNLKNGNTNSCGCFKIAQTKKTNSTHRQSKTRLYSVYHVMLARCYDPENARYPLYGARGIRVCRRWRGKNGFVNFAADMGERPRRKLSLERKNNNGPYSSINCRWASQKEQTRNRRGNVVAVFRGHKACLAEHCERLGVPYSRVHWRIQRGWSLERALTLPAHGSR